MKKKILVTGSAGFIGFHLSNKLIKSNYEVVGIDNLNDYYDKKLKRDRLKTINKNIQNEKYDWKFLQIDITKEDDLQEIFNKFRPNVVVHLAAQAGVRYSIKNPHAYINSNIVGFQNILDCCKTYQVKNFLYASSSSVYGGNKLSPFSEAHPVNHPVSIYAATKKANELFAHSYSHLYNIASTGMRFFTVYGPWGRPDMAPMIFAKSIFSRKPIKIFNFGKMSRSFTFIDDVVESIERLIEKPAIPDFNFDKRNPNPSTSWCPHRIFNIGNNNSVNLEEFISLLEKEIGIKAVREYHNMQPGDVKETCADNRLFRDWVGFLPETDLRVGIKEFIKWYKNYYVS
tara:strand:+ start:5067 stop:6095 length:1029 start_codon:yes stop_codon:yes gene_type:complete